MTEKRSSIDADGVSDPFATEVVPWKDHGQGERFGIRFQELGEFGGGTHVGVCMEVLELGKQSNPAHYHMLEEEHVLVLEGRCTLRLGDRRYAVSAGSYADSGRVYPRLTGEGYRKSATMDYWEGEEV